MKYRHLIWDFDNTLCATYPAMAQALQGALRVEDIESPIEPILDLLHETLLSDCIATIARQHDLDLDPFKMRFLDDYAAMPLAEQRPYPGVVAILERVRENGGKNFLFTHRGCKTLTEALRVHDLARFFTEALSTQDGYPRKPDPGAFNHLIDTYALPHDRTLCVGDRDLDIQAGEAAGLDTCLFGAQPTEAAQPTYVIDDYQQLDAILDSLE
jgi:phosphoglycolate phosphatase-like HAD superfamily hydrolase